MAHGGRRLHFPQCSSLLHILCNQYYLIILISGNKVLHVKIKVCFDFFVNGFDSIELIVMRKKKCYVSGNKQSMFYHKTSTGLMKQ